MVYRQGIYDLNRYRSGRTSDWTVPPAPTKELEDRVKALEDLLRQAKKYDEATGQPDCESTEKRKELQALADKLGVKINFPA
jgi:hypothetical protein